MGTSLWLPSSSAGGAKLLGGFHGACRVLYFRAHKNFVPVVTRFPYSDHNVGTREEGQVGQRPSGGGRVVRKNKKQAFVRALLVRSCRTVLAFRDNLLSSMRGRYRPAVCHHHHHHHPQQETQRSPASSCAPTRSSQCRRSRGVFSPHLSHPPGFLASGLGLPVGTSTRCHGSARCRPAAMAWHGGTVRVVVCCHNSARNLAVAT